MITVPTLEDRELRELAWHWVNGRMFAAINLSLIGRIDLIPYCFNFLRVLDEQDVEQIKRELLFMYEFIDEHTMEVNGLPVFSTIRFMSNAQGEQFFIYAVQIQRDFPGSPSPDLDQSASLLS